MMIPSLMAQLSCEDRVYRCEGGGGGQLRINTGEELIQLKLKIVLSFSSHLNNNYSKVVLRRFSLGRLEGWRGLRRRKTNISFHFISDKMILANQVLFYCNINLPQLMSNQMLENSQKMIYKKLFPTGNTWRVTFSHNGRYI